MSLTYLGKPLLNLIPHGMGLFSVQKCSRSQYKQVVTKLNSRISSLSTFKRTSSSKEMLPVIQEAKHLTELILHVLFNKNLPL